MFAVDPLAPYVLTVPLRDRQLIVTFNKKNWTLNQPMIMILPQKTNQQKPKPPLDVNTIRLNMFGV